MVRGRLGIIRRSLLAVALVCAAAPLLRAQAPRPALPANPLRISEQPISSLPTQAEARSRITAVPVGAQFPVSPAPSVRRPPALQAGEQIPTPPDDESPIAPLIQPSHSAEFSQHPAEHLPPEHWPGEAPAHAYSQQSLLPAWFAHTDPNDPERHWGWGDPLVGTSWRNRPWYVGFFFGGVLADDLIDDRVSQNNGAFFGARLGCDFDHYWGIEGRYAFARLNTTNAAGLQFDDSYDYWLDVSILHYPWGDTRIRPYLQAGLGFSTYRFTDTAVIHDSALTLPLGGGVKYFYSPWCSLRFDVTDNLSFGTGTLDTMHNLSFTAGVEFRFGGRRPSYFPWHGGTALW